MRFTKISTFLGAAALGVAVAAVAVPAPTAHAAPLTNLFTYQGRLDSAGIPVNANVDMRFRLFDGAVLVAQAFYDNVSNPRVFVNRGLFKVDIDFGLANFASGNELTLEIAVRNPPGIGAYTVLTPNQTIRTTPQALFAKEAASLVLPYTDSAASANPLVNLSNTTDGEEGLRVATGASTPIEFQNAVVRAVSSSTAVGIYGSSDRWGTLGLAQSATGLLPTGIQGEVAFGANSGAVAGRFLGNGGDVTLGTDSYAADFQNGDALLRGGFLRKSYGAGTSNLAIPIAYANISSAGVVLSGTPNVTAVWNAALSRYEVTVAGENYFFTDYITNVTSSSSADVRFAASSVGGDMLVFARNAAGASVQSNFSFVMYRPGQAALRSTPLPRSPDRRISDSDWLDKVGVRPAPADVSGDAIPPKERREDTSVQSVGQRAGK